MFEDGVSIELTRAVYQNDGSVRLYVPEHALTFTTKLQERVPAPYRQMVRNAANQFQYWLISDPLSAVQAVALFQEYWPNAPILDNPPPFDFTQKQKNGRTWVDEHVHAEQTTIFDEVVDRPLTNAAWDELAARFKSDREEAAKKRRAEQADADRQERERQNAKARDEYWRKSNPNSKEWDRNAGNGQHVPPPKPTPKASPSPFAVFYLLDTAPEWAVKAVYRAAMKEHHPDNPAAADKTGEFAKKLNIALQAIKKLRGWP